VKDIFVYIFLIAAFSQSFFNRKIGIQAMMILKVILNSFDESENQCQKEI
jgi:hypothetical protein